jgi:putative salt-induced outer membrane protein YdiY
MTVVISRAFALCTFIATAMLASAAAQAVDRVELRDGSIVLGTLKDADSGKIYMETTFAGTLEIDQAEVVGMNVESTLVLQMDDGKILEASQLQVANEELTLEQQADQTYALTSLTRINPEPWELGNGYKFSGNTSVGFNSQRGNTDVDQLNYRLESIWRSLKDRYRLEAFGEVNEAQGVKNAENWTVRTRYDRLQTGDWYWGGGASFEQDSFADLDLRSTIGPYVGRKFYTEPVFELEAEAGASYIAEDFSSAEDREYIGGTWNLNMRSNVLGNDSRIYYIQNGILNFEELENLVLQNTLGIAFPLLYGIEGAAEFVYDINTGAVEGTEKIDQTYRLRLGYTW